MAKQSKYETHVVPNLDKIVRWAESGATAKAISEKIGIAYSTFRDYIQDGKKGDERYAVLSAAFVQACEVADGEVEAALYRSCIGYNAQVKKNFKIKTVKYDETTGKKIGEVESLVVAIDEVHVPANVIAQQFWLTNRKSAHWKYKPEPGDGEEKGETGVVEVPSVMDAPPPPEVPAESNE